MKTSGSWPTEPAASHTLRFLVQNLLPGVGGLRSHAQPTPLVSGGTGSAVTVRVLLPDAVPESIPTAPEHRVQCKGVGGGHRLEGSSHPTMPPPGDGPLTAQSVLEVCLWSVWFTFSPHSALLASCVLCVPIQTGEASVCSPDICSLKGRRGGCP